MGALADANTQSSPADNELRVGTVVQLTNPAGGAADGIYVSFSPADPSATPVRCFALIPYMPAVGDVVQVLRQDSQFLILGVSAPRGLVWTQITPLAGWAVAAGGPVLAYAINLTTKRIYIEGELAGGTNANATAIGTVQLPVTLPKRSTRTIGVDHLPAAGAFTPMMQIQGNSPSSLTIFGCTSAGILYINVDFPYTAA